MMSTSDQTTREQMTEAQREELINNLPYLYIGNTWGNVQCKKRNNNKAVSKYGKKMRDFKAGVLRDWNITLDKANLQETDQYGRFDREPILNNHLCRVASNMTKKDEQAAIEAVLYLWVNNLNIEQALYKAKDELQGPHYLINPVIKCFLYMKYAPADIYYYIMLLDVLMDVLDLPDTSKNIYEIEASDFNIMLYTGIKDYSINNRAFRNN
jgi:hypothetical protein